MQKPIKLIGYYLIVLTLFASCMNALSLSVAEENGGDLEKKDQESAKKTDGKPSTETDNPEPPKAAPNEEQKSTPPETGRGGYNYDITIKEDDSRYDGGEVSPKRWQHIYPKCREYTPENPSDGGSGLCRTKTALEALCAYKGQEFVWYQPHPFFAVPLTKIRDDEFRTEEGEIVPLNKVFGIIRCNQPKEDHLELAEDQSAVSIVCSWGKYPGYSEDSLSDVTYTDEEFE